MIRVLIADDHPIVRRGLRQMLCETDDIVVVDEARDCSEVLQKLQEHRADVVLLDIAMPGRGGIDVLKELRGAGIKVSALMLSIFPEEQYAVRALRSGASGYLTKNCDVDTLVEAIRKVAGGGKYVSPSLGERLASTLQHDSARPLHQQLSDREFEVLKRLASGGSVREIAEAMRLSAQTVSTYRARILAKLQLKNVSEITAYAFRNHLLDP
ncbi:MAG: response regulator transcription factor [Spirochaetales bacterium]|nr:response regulator transcription factor [Spirochaetales bacterium]